MDIVHLRCFLAGADLLHFGKAAQSLDMMPAAFGRQIQGLERELHVRLFVRSTRTVTLTEAGKLLQPRARSLVDEVDGIRRMMQGLRLERSSTMRIGTIDSAAVGLMPMLIQDVKHAIPDLEIVLIEDKTIRLIPQLLSGGIDLAFIRPPERMDNRIRHQPVVFERPTLALPVEHPLALAPEITVSMLDTITMILPSRRSRPHSHGLTVQIFASAGVPLEHMLEAEEKHTILGLVAAGLGAAIVPRWSALSGMSGVVFRDIVDAGEMHHLPLAVAWIDDWHDARRDAVIDLLQVGRDRYQTTS